MFAENDTVLDFNQAARDFPAAMKHIQEIAAQECGAGFLQSIPVLTFDEWNVGDDEEGPHYNNCMNFALHRNTLDVLMPGKLGANDEQDYCRIRTNDHFIHYSRDVIAGVIKDGLIPIGFDLRKAVHYTAPVALFLQERSDNSLNEHDFHWFALRREFAVSSAEPAKLVWGHKPGSHPVEDCEPYDDNIFEAAEDDGFYTFAGYYAVPEKLMQPPIKVPA